MVDCTKDEMENNKDKKQRVVRTYIRVSSVTETVVNLMVYRLYPWVLKENIF